MKKFFVIFVVVISMAMGLASQAFTGPFVFFEESIMHSEKILIGIAIFILLGLFGMLFLLILRSTNDLVCAMSFVVSTILGCIIFTSTVYF